MQRGRRCLYVQGGLTACAQRPLPVPGSTPALPPTPDPALSTHTSCQGSPAFLGAPFPQPELLLLCWGLCCSPVSFLCWGPGRAGEPQVGPPSDLPGLQHRPAPRGLPACSFTPGSGPLTPPGGEGPWQVPPQTSRSPDLTVTLSPHATGGVLPPGGGESGGVLRAYDPHSVPRLHTIVKASPAHPEGTKRHRPPRGRGRGVFFRAFARSPKVCRGCAVLTVGRRASTPVPGAPWAVMGTHCVLTAAWGGSPCWLTAETEGRRAVSEPELGDGCPPAPQRVAPVGCAPPPQHGPDFALHPLSQALPPTGPSEARPRRRGAVGLHREGREGLVHTPNHTPNAHVPRAAVHRS